MSLSAREKVFRVRWAEHQVNQLQKKLLQNFPNLQKPLDLNNYLETKEYEKQKLNMKNPLIKNGLPMGFHEYAARQNFLASLSNNGRSKPFVLPIRTRSSSHNTTKVSLDLDLSSSTKSSKTRSKKNKKKDAFHDQNQRRSSFGQLESNSETNRLEIKNSIDVMKTKVLPPLPPKKRIESEKTQGRMFRHRYKFQDSAEPSPDISRSNSGILKKSGSNTPKQRASESELFIPSASPSLTPFSHQSGTQSPNSFSRTESSIGSYRISKENLCLPSLLMFKKKNIQEKGPKTWVERRFPKLSDEVHSWHNRHPFMNIKKELTYPTLGHENNGKRGIHNSGIISSTESSNVIQPLPHRRGLVGIEISEFDSEYAVFYKNKNGIFNPHLHKDQNANYVNDKE